MSGLSLSKKLRGLMGRHVPLMVTCREFEDFMLDYFEGDLSRRKRIVFDMHLWFCPDCRSYLEAYRRSMALSKAVFEDDAAAVPASVPGDLVRAVMAARSTKD